MAAHLRKRSVRLLLACLVGLVGGCAALDPAPVSMNERLSAFPRDRLPLDAAATVRWNAYQIPFIEAATDRDLAFALGMTHAHLRLGQIRLLKQISQGRLSEMAGPFRRDIDVTIRMVDFGRAAPEIYRRMTPEARTLLDAFVAGLNHYQERMPAPPPEFALLGLSPEPFTAEDLITIGRLSGLDFNWTTLLSVLPQRDRPDWGVQWARLLDKGIGQTTSFDPGTLDPDLQKLFAGFSRPGSNAVVVAPEKSASGSALIAGDPHLGISIPNLWLIAGVRSPSFVGVGLMLPGLPFIVEGRSPALAWAGTNMRSANSDFYDISKLRDAEITERTTTIASRLWFDTKRTIRDSRLGPVISDSSQVTARPGETIALRWVGHEPSDEVDAFFNVMRAGDAMAFRSALSGFAAPPQNYLCADAKGNICHVLATRLPIRGRERPPGPVLDAADPANDWRGIADARTLPAALNPKQGFLASANNRPAETPFPIGYFFGSHDRIVRLQEALAGKDKVSVADLKELQRDTLSHNARDLAAALTDLIARNPAARSAAPEFVAELARFDGDYRIDGRGPVVFEFLLFHLVPAVYGAPSADDVPSTTKDLNQLSRYLVADIKALGPDRAAEVLAGSLAKADADARPYRAWGDIHRLRIAHPLGFLPLIGGAFVYDLPAVGGSRETLMKASHGLVNGPHQVSFGSQARFVADLGDLDANEFVLIGGNDGWLGSANLLDQVPLWLEGRTIRMPLRPETVRREFPQVMTLAPETSP